MDFYESSVWPELIVKRIVGADRSVLLEIVETTWSNQCYEKTCHMSDTVLHILTISLTVAFIFVRVYSTGIRSVDLIVTFES